MFALHSAALYNDIWVYLFSVFDVSGYLIFVRFFGSGSLPTGAIRRRPCAFEWKINLLPCVLAWHGRCVGCCWSRPSPQLGLKFSKFTIQLPRELDLTNLLGLALGRISNPTFASKRLQKLQKLQKNSKTHSDWS